jgi:hypothetical protein
MVFRYTNSETGQTGIASGTSPERVAMQMYAKYEGHPDPRDTRSLEELFSHLVTHRDSSSAVIGAWRVTRVQD